MTTKTEDNRRRRAEKVELGLALIATRDSATLLQVSTLGIALVIAALATSGWILFGFACVIAGVAFIGWLARPFVVARSPSATAAWVAAALVPCAAVLAEYAASRSDALDHWLRLGPLFTADRFPSLMSLFVLAAVIAIAGIALRAATAEFLALFLLFGALGMSVQILALALWTHRYLPGQWAGFGAIFACVAVFWIIDRRILEAAREIGPVALRTTWRPARKIGHRLPGSIVLGRAQGSLGALAFLLAFVFGIQNVPALVSRLYPRVDIRVQPAYDLATWWVPNDGEYFTILFGGRAAAFRDRATYVPGSLKATDQSGATETVFGALAASTLVLPGGCVLPAEDHSPPRRVSEFRSLLHDRETGGHLVLSAVLSNETGSRISVDEVGVVVLSYNSAPRSVRLVFVPPTVIGPIQGGATGPGPIQLQGTVNAIVGARQPLHVRHPELSGTQTYALEGFTVEAGMAENLSADLVLVADGDWSAALYVTYRIGADSAKTTQVPAVRYSSIRLVGPEIRDLQADACDTHGWYLQPQP